ncbi:MAG TPA: methyltransferase domain-containing protein, partial [Thermoanaerobaculia bacterium]|nr:methyltransferase domain-containing protein [Thermoanaerobaculia bacterium]
STPSELGGRTGTHERYVREWLEQQAAAEILGCEDPAAPAAERRFFLPAAVAEVLTERESLLWSAARPRSLVALAQKLPALLEAFRTGDGIPEGTDDARTAQADLGRAAFLRLLASDWLPRIVDVDGRLRSEPPARVLDVGCGAGWATIALAKGYPLVHVDGLDFDPLSIDTARTNADTHGVGSRTAFHTVDAASPGLPGEYDLVVAFESLHDMPRPVEALEAMRRLAAPAGAILVVEEKSAEAFSLPASPNDRLNYGWSVLTCLSSAMNGPDAAGTGTVLRRDTLERYARQAGFSAIEDAGVPHEAWTFWRMRP